MSRTPQSKIRKAEEGDVTELSHLRLEALRTEPAAFSSDYDAARNQTPAQWSEWFTERCNGSTRVIFLAQAGNDIVGMAGIARERSPKAQHAAFIWGVFVRPEFRGTQIGKGLTEACLQWGRDHGVEVVHLDVNSANVSAIRLYASCGFQVCGLLPKVLRVNGIDHDEMAMVRMLETA